MNDDKALLYIVAIVAIVSIVALIMVSSNKTGMPEYMAKTLAAQDANGQMWKYTECYGYCTSWGPVGSYELTNWCKRDCTTHSSSDLNSGRA